MRPPYLLKSRAMNNKINPRDKIKGEDLIFLMKTLTTEEIATRYKVSIHVVLLEIGKQFKKRNIGFAGYQNQDNIEEMDLECKGAWTEWGNRNTNIQLLKSLRKD